MGYANIKQRGQGLHLRQFARAFIVDDGIKRIVFVSVDGAMISHAVKRDVNCFFFFCNLPPESITVSRITCLITCNYR